MVANPAFGASIGKIVTILYAHLMPVAHPTVDQSKQRFCGCLADE
jgi:hypothetical protein